MNHTDATILAWEAQHPDPTYGGRVRAARKLGMNFWQWNIRLAALVWTRDALEAEPAAVYRLRGVVERTTASR